MKFKNVMLGLVIALAVSCGSKETKEADAKADSTQTEAPVAATPAATKDLIAKEWVLDAIDYGAGLNAAKDKAAYAAQMEKVIAEMKGKSTLNLSADGKAAMDMVDYEYAVSTYTGTWTLIDEDKTLSITSKERTDPFEWTIWEISDNSLELLINDTTIRYVPKK